VGVIAVANILGAPEVEIAEGVVGVSESDVFFSRLVAGEPLGSMVVGGFNGGLYGGLLGGFGGYASTPRQCP
jgi:hypothetical protein